jgi:exodeoxyribonuclease VIII
MHITNGIHKGLADPTYRAIEGLSQSAMKSLMRSPGHFKHQQENPRTGTPAMIMGRLFHHLALTPDVAPWWAIKPDGMSFATKEGKAWRAEQTGEIVSQDQWEQSKGMAMAVRQHPSLPTFEATEVSVFGEMDGVTVKARLDALAGDIWDLKSTDDARPEGFGKSIFTYGYYIQAAFYLDLYNEFATKKAESFYFVAVESEPPHGCRIYRLSDAAVEQGRNEYRKLLQVFKFCAAHNSWPIYADEVSEIGLPGWAIKEVPANLFL